MKKEKKQKKQRSPFLWLLMIPIKVLVDFIFLTGVYFFEIEFWRRQMLKNAAEGYGGHGIPIFLGLSLLLALATSVIVLLVSIIVTCVKLYLRNRERKAAGRKEQERYEYKDIYCQDNDNRRL